MTSTATALWERQPQARISLWKALDLFEAACRARNLSPSTIAWYRERLTPFFRHLENALGCRASVRRHEATVFRRGKLHGSRSMGELLETASR